MKKIILLPLICISSFVSISVASEAKAALLNSEKTLQIENEYQFGEYFIVPNLTKDGIEYTSVLEFPDGSATHEVMVTLNQSGTYKIHYSGEKEGKYYSESYSFIVKNQAYSFSGPKSFASYENSERTYGKEGLYVALQEGETMNFSSTIDLSSSSKNDMLIDLFVAPLNERRADFQVLYLTFSDAEVPSSNFSVRIIQSNDNHDYSYLAGSPDGAPYAGLQEHNGRIIYHSNNEFGYPIIHSFYGDYPIYKTDSAGTQSVKLYYEAESKALYAAPEAVYPICDFDDPKFFASPWAGFPSGKVNLSISAGSYVSEKAYFLIKSAKGINLTQKIIEDTTPPEITVDIPSPYSESNLPKALKGFEYPVFNASAKDEISGAVDVKSYVLYHYDGEKTVMVNVKDNKFITNRKGQYDIVYEAKDAVGNIATKTISISSVEYPMPINIVPVSSPVSICKRGEVYEFPSFRVEGGSGILSNEFQVTHNGILVEQRKNSFIPKEVGKYTIRFVVSDMIGQKEIYQYELNVNENNGVVIYDDPKLPKYFLETYQYELPLIYATDFGANEALVPCEVDVTMGGNTTTMKSGSYFIPNNNENEGNIIIVYKYKEAQKRFEIPCIPVYSGIQMKMDKYFIKDGIELNTAFDLYSEVISAKEGDCSWEFANPLFANGTTIEFSSIASESRFSSLNFSFVDAYDETEKITLRLEKRTDGSIYAKGGSSMVKTDLSFTSTKAATISYSNGVFTINSVSINVDKYDDGRLFEGFSSSFIYLSSMMEGASNGAKYRLSKIDNQTICDIAFDPIEPIISLLGASTGGRKEKGETFTISPAIAFDVLDPSVELKLKVTGPDGNIVTSLDGNPLSEISADRSYEIVLDQYGSYGINYMATDSSGNTRTNGINLTVVQNTNPKINITSSYKTEINLGETIILPDYEVVFPESSADQSIYCSIQTPNGSIIVLNQGSNSFVPKTPGEYVVKIHAMDGEGNKAVFEYEVMVNEKEGK
ncbi:MAG: hypothetical protein IJ247_06040 [Bacilli bacterium]|nr:hypothetical protein [Bacilli bacterium]